MTYTSLEICAGAGGQALGLEQAGFHHVALVENDPACCNTLRAVRTNRKLGIRTSWKPLVHEIDVKRFYAGDLGEPIDLFAGGVPCPPFSRAGKQLGAGDERDLFPTAVRLVLECMPRAVLLENVRGLLHPDFDGYREEVVVAPLSEHYECYGWRILEAKDFGVPQLRPRALFVAFRKDVAASFTWPGEADRVEPPTVGELLRKEMGRGGWPGATEWARRASGIAPTLVGGSKKHGGPDLGPSQARKQWEKLGVNGGLVATAPPGEEWGDTSPILTVRMTALLQGFPADWPFWGSKTAAYRQVGNAFPPPVAKAIGLKIRETLQQGDSATVPVEPVLLRRAA